MTNRGQNFLAGRINLALNRTDRDIDLKNLIRPTPEEMREKTRNREYTIYKINNALQQLLWHLLDRIETMDVNNYDDLIVEFDMRLRTAPRLIPPEFTPS